MLADHTRSFLAALAVAAFAATATGARPDSPSASLLGTWAGTIEHEGDAQPIALTIEADEGDKLLVRLSMPVIQLDHAVIGRFALEASDDSVKLGPFRLAWAEDGRALRGDAPKGLIPIYRMPMVLRRVEHFEVPARAPITAPERKPKWTYTAGAALWAGPTFEDGVVLAGDEAGVLHAVDARSGRRRWTFASGGPIRVRPVIADGAVYFQADDGLLYALDAGAGTLRWKVRIVDSAVVRLPFSDPESRYDRFGSDVTPAVGRLFVGTHDGRLVALDPADGRTIWSFESGDAVLAAPAASDGRIFFGSFDRHVYALDASDGSLLWKTDTQRPVVSTPAVHGDLAIVGSRSYDLLGLDAGTGAVRWKRYVWMSWIESSARLFDRIAYVGSSDAAAVFAVRQDDGSLVWQADVRGWSWGQPAVTDTRVYAGTSSQVGYPAGHRGGFFALDRADGAVRWHYTTAAPDSGTYGFPGSPALGAGLVFASTLDGRLLAFEP